MLKESLVRTRVSALVCRCKLMGDRPSMLSLKIRKKLHLNPSLMKISPRWAESADAVSRSLPHWQYSPKWNRVCVTGVFQPPPYHCLTCPQVTRLQENVQRGEHDMGAAEGQICTLKEAQDKLLEELDATRARLRETSNLLTALQVCMSERLCSALTRRLTCCTLSYNWPDQLKTAGAELN